MTPSSRLFRFAFGLFLAFAHGQRLLESLADFIQALVIQVVCTLGALGAQVYQFIVFAHGLYVLNTGVLTIMLGDDGRDQR
jgi:hypothetical protein